MSVTHDRQMDLLKQNFGDALLATEVDNAGCPILWVKRERAIEVLKYLKETDGLEYEFLSDLTAYDDMGTKEEAQGRFVMVYNLYAPAHKLRIRVKVRLADGTPMPTAVGVWAGANWAEREVFDLFGIRFDGHPDLRRILMDIRWEGHPLRKDYHWRKYQLFSTPEQMPEHLLKD